MFGSVSHRRIAVRADSFHRARRFSNRSRRGGFRPDDRKWELGALLDFRRSQLTRGSSRRGDACVAPTVHRFSYGRRARADVKFQYARADRAFRRRPVGRRVQVGSRQKSSSSKTPSPRPKSNATFAFARDQTVRTAPGSARVRICMLVLPTGGETVGRRHASSVHSEGGIRFVGARFEKKSPQWARDSSWAICPIQSPIRFCRKRSVVLVMWSPLPLS